MMHEDALWKSQTEDHNFDWIRVVPISGLGQTMNACSRVFVGGINEDHDVSCVGVVGIKHRHNIVRDTLVDICFRSGISFGKEVDIGLGGGWDKPLHPANMLLYSWDGGLDVCVDLTGSSPLTQMGMVDFVSGHAMIDAAQRKRVKYETKCMDIGYGLPFSFSSFCKLVKDAVTLLKQMQKFSMAQDIRTRAAVHIYTDKKVDTGLGGGRDKSLHSTNMSLYSWDGWLDVCVDLTRSSPLTQIGTIDFVPGHAVIEAAQHKRVKYEANHAQLALGSLRGIFMETMCVSCAGIICIKHERNVVRDILIDIYFRLRISDGKEVDIRMRSERDRPLRPTNMLLYSWDRDALWKSQTEDHTFDWIRVVPILGLGQIMNGRTYRCVLCYGLGVSLFYVLKSCSACSRFFVGGINEDHDVSCVGVVGIKHRHNIVRDTLVDICFRSRISSGKEVDIGLGGGWDKPLRPANMLLYSWDGGLDVCVDLTGSSPLTQMRMVDFVSGRAMIDAAQRKRVKYETKCMDIGYGLPFSLSSICKLVKDAVTILKQIQKFSMAQDIGARAAVHIYSRIIFAIARGVETQIVSRLLNTDKKVDTGLGGGRDKSLHSADMSLYSWDGWLDVCVDLTRSSPLTQIGTIDFVPGHAVIEAAQHKRVKYEAKCMNIIYDFLIFSFSSFGKLEKDAGDLA
nr:hypothetical protein [Tanacetum cinerariifolium]